MHRATLLALALSGLLALAPAASAQQAAVVTISVNVPEEDFAPDARVSTTGIITYTADVTTHVSTLHQGVPFRWVVEDAPDWLSVLVSPPEDVFLPPTAPSNVYTSTRAFTVVFDVIPENATADSVGIVRLKAVAAAGILGKSASGIAEVPVRLDVPDPEKDEACDHPTFVLGMPAEAAPAEDGAGEGGEVTLQSRSASVTTPWVAMAGFAAAGAGAGFVLRRRLR